MKDTFDLVETIREERKAELETKRQEKIDQLSKDFFIPREELENDTMCDLLKTEKRLGLAIKRDTEDKPTEDMQVHLDMISEKAKELRERYHLKV